MISLYIFCEKCNLRRLFRFVREVAGWEIYKCLDCGNQKQYKVN